MTFLKSLFNKKDKTINSYKEFWDWFVENEKKFHEVIKQNGDIKKVFFDKLSPKLNQLKDGFWFLAGMCDENTSELVLTADGVLKNIAFVEDLVAVAPKLDNWKITALKQPNDLGRYGINMEGYEFNEKTLCFYAIEHPTMPDEIDIVITHKDLNDENRGVITNGVYLAIDNFLGELNSVTTIDNVTIIHPNDAEKELIPLEKLKSFLVWREKEFIEKYKGLRRNTESDSYSGLEATLQNGLPLIAMVNSDLLEWDSKASHPWITVVEIKYDGKNNNGMPSESTYELLNEIEDKIMQELKDAEGFLNIGRETADSVREVYFACIDFRKPSKVLHKFQLEYQNQIEFSFDIYKDKYWQSFNRFIAN